MTTSEEFVVSNDCTPFPKGSEPKLIRYAFLFMNRRDFLAASASVAAGVLFSSSIQGMETKEPTTRAQPRIPNWRGFNLTELTGGERGRKFLESDFAWMAEWGFNFARLPLSYWAWSSPKDWNSIDEHALAPIDQAIAWGRQYGIHINLCLHRIPGYCINGREAEPFQLFESTPDSMARAFEAATHHWRFFAKRYHDIPAAQLSFDLLNEPPFMPDQSRYVAVIRTLVGAIREQSPDRLIVADGADIGQTPIWDVVDLGIVQSTRGYQPKMVSHYTATWVPANEFESTEKPTWPMVDKLGQRWDREKLRAELITKWQPLV